MVSIHSPFRYAGGKYYARKLIISHLPTHTCYIEPFAGGGSIFFAKPKVIDNTLNDIDDELIKVYQIIRNRPNDLIKFLADCAPPSKESHNYYKNEYKPTTELEEVGRWYFLNRISYSGIMKKQNCFWGYGPKYSMRPEYWPRAILAASEKLDGVTIVSDDFESVIQRAPDDSLLFIDPPYYAADQDKFYTKSFTPACHDRLCDVLKRHSERLRFLLTYDNCEPIKQLYAWATVEAQEWNYCLSRSDDQKNRSDAKGKRDKGRELFIRNYSLRSSDIFDNNPDII